MKQLVLQSVQFTLRSCPEGIYTYACTSTRLSVLYENNINTIRGTDNVSRDEKLPVEHGLSCWKITKWMNTIRFLSDSGIGSSVNHACAHMYEDITVYHIFLII